MEEKQLFGYFKRQIGKISHDISETWLRRRNLKRVTRSFSTEAQNNSIRAKYIKAKINVTQQNIKFRLNKYRDKTVNHMISECRKLALKQYKIRYN